MGNGKIVKVVNENDVETLIKIIQMIFDLDQDFLCYLPSEYVISRIYQGSLDDQSRFNRMVPVRQIALGRQIGSGGTNSVHMIDYVGGGCLEGMLIKDAGASGGQSKEYEALRDMERIGLRTCARGLTRMGPKTMLVMDMISGCTDSKSIVGYLNDKGGISHSLKDYIDPGCANPAPPEAARRFITKATIKALLYGYQRMVKFQRSYFDFQFLISPAGDVIYNDPTGHSPSQQPHKTTKMVIQAMIDTWEFFNLGQLAPNDWMAFKTFKEAELRARMACLGSLRRSFIAPAFNVLDQSLFDADIAAYPCAMFTLGQAASNSAREPDDNWLDLTTDCGRSLFPKMPLLILEKMQKAIRMMVCLNAAISGTYLDRYTK